MGNNNEALWEDTELPKKAVCDQEAESKQREVGAYAGMISKT